MDTAQLTHTSLLTTQKVVNGHFIAGSAFCSVDNQVLRAFPRELACFTAFSDYFFLVYGGKLAMFRGTEEAVIYEIPSDLRAGAIQVSADYICLVTEFPEITLEVYELYNSKLKRLISVQIPFSGHQAEKCVVQIINNNFLVAFETEAFQVVMQQASSYFYADVLPVVPGALVSGFDDIPQADAAEVVEKQADAKQTSIIVQADNFQAVDLQQNLAYLKQTTAAHLDIEPQPQPQLSLLKEYAKDTNNIIETPEYFKERNVGEDRNGVISVILREFEQKSVTDGSAYLEELVDLEVLDFENTFHIKDVAVSKNCFVICDRCYGLIIVPEIVPPKSLANILHPKCSVSYIWRNVFKGVLSAMQLPNMFGFEDGSVMIGQMVYNGKSPCREIVTHQENTFVVFADICGYLSDKCDFTELFQLCDHRLPVISEKSPEFMKYICAENFKHSSLITPFSDLSGRVRDHLCSITLPSGDIIADPVLCSVRLHNFMLTGHASGYLRVFSDYQNQLRLLQKLRLSSVGILRISASISEIVCSDAAGTLFFVSGIEKEFTVLGYVNVGDFSGISRCFGDFVQRCASADCIITEEGGNANIRLKNSLDSDVLKPGQQRNESLRQFYFEASPLKEISPLSVPHVTNGICYAITCIQVCHQYVYVALSSGTIIRLQFPSAERVLTELENTAILRLADLKETLASSSQRELEMLEGRFLAMEASNRLEISELKPIQLKTCLSITALCVDEAAVPPPLVISDLIYIGLADGRVFIYMLKSEADQSSGAKIDFPLVQREILKMRTKVCNITLESGILGITDESGVFIAAEAARPQVTYLKKIAELCARNEDVVQNLISSEVDAPDVAVSIEEKKTVNSKLQSIYIDITEKFLQIQLLRAAPHFVEFVTEKETTFLDVFGSYGENYRIRLPAAFTAACQAAADQVEQFSKQFVVLTLQEQAASDQAQVMREELKESYERRIAARNLIVDQNLVQLTLSIPSMEESGQNHPFEQIISQKFSYLMKKPFAVHPMQDGKSEITENLVFYIEERKDIMSLIPVGGSLELPYCNVPRALELLISSSLRVRVNERLIEESEKIAESLQEIDRENQEVLRDKHLCVVAKNAPIVRIENLAKTIPTNEIGESDDVSPSKLLKSTHYLPENQIHISHNVVNKWRAAFLTWYSAYERAFKGDVLRAKAFQALGERAMLENAGEAVAGLLDKKSYVPGFAYKKFAPPRKLLLLRTAEIASELFKPHQPAALVLGANGQMSSANENIVETRNSETFSELATECKPAEHSGTVELIRGYGLKMQRLPDVVEVLGGSDYINDNYQKMPSASLYALPQAGYKTAVLAETDVICPVRARQQALLLKHHAGEICREGNESLGKLRDQKFRHINKIQEIAQNIKEIGSELIYHAREETLLQMIEQRRRQLQREFEDEGLAPEECCARAAKQCIQQLPADDAIIQQAMQFVDMKLLDFTEVLMQVRSSTECEQIANAIGYDPQAAEELSTELRKLAGQSVIERAAITAVSALREAAQNAQTSQAAEESSNVAFNTLTDEGRFHIVNIGQLLTEEKQKLSQTGISVSDRVERLAAAYKRALYEMMRGSVDASNRQTVRDIPVPAALGLAKPSKEQEQQIEMYKEKLADIEQRRAKEKKQLTAMCLKLREQADELCRVFDTETLKQFRERRFRDEVAVQALQMQFSALLNYSISSQRFKGFEDAAELRAAQIDVAARELGEQRLRVEEALRKREERHSEARVFSRHIDQNKKTIFANPDLQKFFQGFKLNYSAIKEQIRATFSKAVSEREGLTYEEIQSGLEQIYTGCATFSKEMLGDALETAENLEKELLDKFTDSITPLSTMEPIIPTHSGYDRLEAFLQLPPVYNVYYIELISKLFPIQQLPEFAQETTKPNFEAPEMIVFDVCRCVKTLLELVIVDSLEKFNALQNCVVYLSYLGNQYSLMGDSIVKAHHENAEAVNKQLLNPSVATLFRMGQVESYRQWDTYFERKKLEFMREDVIQDEERTAEPTPAFLLKDDSTCIVVDISFIKDVNSLLCSLGEQRVNRLTALAKFRQRQEILSHEIVMLQYEKADYTAQTRDYQLIRVSKDMHGMIRENISINAKKAREIGVVERKLEHERKAHEVENTAGETKLLRIPEELKRINSENQSLKSRIEELAMANEQRKEALPEFAGDQAAPDAAEANEEALKKFRRIAALRKMRELSKAQEEEMQFLIAELEKLRNRTYPSFE